jgi:membrane protein implicated in regulation of membrane protease activity
VTRIIQVGSILLLLLIVGPFLQLFFWAGITVVIGLLKMATAILILSVCAVFIWLITKIATRTKRSKS